MIKTRKIRNMKKIFVMLLLLSGISPLFSQNAKYVAAMKKALVQLDSAGTPEQLLAVANTFARIGNAEKGEWLPAYYESYSRMNLAFQLFPTDLQKASATLTEAEGALARARAVRGEDSELDVLEAYIIMGRVSENPMANGQTMTGKFFEVLGKAGAINPENPRVPLLQAVYTLNMPDFFGGGLEKAKPLFEKTKELLEKAETPADSLLPAWGKGMYQHFATSLGLK